MRGDLGDEGGLPDGTYKLARTPRTHRQRLMSEAVTHQVHPRLGRLGEQEGPAQIPSASLIREDESAFASPPTPHVIVMPRRSQTPASAVGTGSPSGERSPPLQKVSSMSGYAAWTTAREAATEP